MTRINGGAGLAQVVLGSAVLLSLAGSAVAAGPAELYLSGLKPGGTSLFTLDLATGADTWIAFVEPAGGGAANIANGGLAYDPFTDSLYATGNDNASVSKLYRIDPATGVATEIGPTGDPLDSGGLAFDLQTRTLYSTGRLASGPPVQATYLFTVNTATGAATSIGHTGTPGTYLYGLGYDPVSGVLYANGYRNFDQRSALFTVDKATGVATFIGEHGVYVNRGLNYGSLAFDPLTHVLYAPGSVSASANGLYTVNPATGTATLIGMFANASPEGGLTFVGSYATGAPESRPAGLRLHANYPNPFNPLTTLRFDYPAGGRVRLEVYDVAGRLIRTLLDADLPAGSHRAVWDGKDERGMGVASGSYFARLSVDGRVETVRMGLIR
jgi:hypothetical protein